jgi:hypothetical protein
MPSLLWAYNILADISLFALVACLLVFLPMAIFRSLRKTAGKVLKYSSFIFWLELWMYALGALWHYWGLVAVLVGVLTTPIGASLVAVIALVAERDWRAVFAIVGQIAISFSAFAGGEKLIESGSGYESKRTSSN